MVVGYIHSKPCFVDVLLHGERSNEEQPQTVRVKRHSLEVTVEMGS